MTLLWIPTLLALACAVLALALLRRPRRRSARMLRVCAGLLFAVLALSLGLLAAVLMQFQRLSEDVPVAVIELRQTGPQRFQATLVSGDRIRRYELHGDQWQLDAQVLRWRLPALLAGAPTLYRLERLSGRYVDVGREREAPRSVHDLGDGTAPGLDRLVEHYPRFLPFIDAQWGSGAYLPMADGARYEVLLNPRGGLVARPLGPQD